MSYHCPNCNRMLYNRRLLRCGYCDAPIPESLRFTVEEVASLDRSMEEMEEQSRRREREREEEDKKKAAGQGLDGGSFFPP